MQGLQCGWVNNGETHTQQQDRNPIPKRIGEAGEAYLFTWIQPIPQNLLNNKCSDSGSLQSLILKDNNNNNNNLYPSLNPKQYPKTSLSSHIAIC